MLNSLLRLQSSSEFVGQMDEDDQPFIYRRTLDIPAPGLSMLIFYYLFCIVWYGFFIWIALAAMGIGFQPAIVYASLVLAGNGAARTSMRFRECTATHVHWQEPVARQRRSILIISVLTGALCAFVGFGLLVLLIPEVRDSSFWPFMLLLGAGLEGYRGAAKVGEATIDDDFDIDNHREWTRLGPADP